MNWWQKFIHPVTAHFRKKRGDFMLMQFPDIRHYKICDLGGSRHFWEKINLDVPPKNITVFNITDSETQAIGEIGHDDIRVVIYDGKSIPVPDKEFDLLVCNSVLEHVPPEARAALVSEMRRVAKSVFCQTPAYSFPIEPHFVFPFVHWLPRTWGFWLIHLSPWRILSKPSRDNIREYWWGTQLLRAKEVNDLFPDAVVGHERFLGLIKSYYVVHNS